MESNSNLSYQSRVRYKFHNFHYLFNDKLVENDTRYASYYFTVLTVVLS